MTIFDKETETTTVRILRRVHTQLKSLYPLAGYEFLEDFINEGLENWITFIQAELKQKENQKK